MIINKYVIDVIIIDTKQFQRRLTWPKEIPLYDVKLSDFESNGPDGTFGIGNHFPYLLNL